MTPILPFLRVAMRDIRVGAVMPSSSYAVRAILSRLPERFGRVLEYGPGDGVLTRALLERLDDDGRYLAIETNDRFFASVSAFGDPRLETVHGNALAADRFAEERGLGGFDLVISGIPFSLFPQEERHRAVAMTHRLLRPGGIFLVYQVSPLMRPYLRKAFAVSTAIEPRNIPPYFILRAVKEQP